MTMVKIILIAVALFTIGFIAKKQCFEDEKECCEQPQSSEQKGKAEKLKGGDEKLIVACKLNSAEQVKRRASIRKELFSKSTKVQELSNGFEWTFPGQDELSAKLLEFVNFERDCCAFFTFSLTFSPDKKNIKLAITGEKEILKSDFFPTNP